MAFCWPIGEAALSLNSAALTAEVPAAVFVRVVVVAFVGCVGDVPLPPTVPSLSIAVGWLPLFGLLAPPPRGDDERGGDGWPNIFLIPLSDSLWSYVVCL